MRWDHPTEIGARLVRALEQLAIAARACWSDTDGQGIVEYGLILSLSALFAAVLLVFFGGTLSALLQAVGDAIDSAT
jgi:Flp pilus assembly pilin Flp